MYSNTEELQLAFKNVPVDIPAPLEEGYYQIRLPNQTLQLKRHAWYWVVRVEPGLSKEAAVDLCRAHGKVVRALGYGRRPLSPEELEGILSNRYHQELYEGYCLEWHCDTITGLQILVERLAEGNK